MEMVLGAQPVLGWGHFILLLSGLFPGVSVLLWALTGWAGKRTPLLVLQYVLAASLAIGVVVPVTKAFSSSYKTGEVPKVGLMNYLTQNHGQPVTDPPSARLETSQLFVPGRTAESREAKAYGGGRYLGLMALGLALFGVIRRPRKALPWLLIGAVGVVFAFGTYWTVNGTEVTTDAGVRLVMPTFWLDRVLGCLAEPLNSPFAFWPSPPPLSRLWLRCRFALGNGRGWLRWRCWRSSLVSSLPIRGRPFSHATPRPLRPCVMSTTKR